MKIDHFHNIHQGRRAFIIGNGPSLRDTDLEPLRNEITFGTNRIYLSGFVPKYWTCGDWLVLEENHREIRALEGPVKFLPESSRGQFGNGFVYYEFDKAFVERRGPLCFSMDAGRRICSGGTVTYICLQLAYYMGIQTVYLIGVDHNYVIPPGALKLQDNGDIWQSTGPDPNHFHPDYFGPGRRFHNPMPERMEQAHWMAKEVYQANGREILNAGIRSELEVFPRVDYAALFGPEHPVRDQARAAC